MGKFSAQVGRFADQFEKRFRAVARTAVQETVSEAQRTIGDGGRMRVDTGFLRASIQAALGTMPKGETAPRKGATTGEYNAQLEGDPIAVTLLKWRPEKNEILYVGWTAGYARAREAHDGFVRGAAENWDNHVRQAVKKVNAGL